MEYKKYHKIINNIKYKKIKLLLINNIMIMDKIKNIKII